MRQSMIFMVPKFTGAAYFAATEKGAKEAVAELKGKGVAIDFLYTGPSVANTDEQIRIIDDLVAQKPKRPRPPGSRSSPMTRTWPIPLRVSGS